MNTEDINKIHEDINKIHDIVLEDRRVKIREIADIVYFTYKHMQNILQKKIG